MTTKRKSRTTPTPKLIRFDITPEAADLIADALDIISPDDDDMCRLASDLAILFRQS